MLIGRPDATPSRATGCAVYQLTSAYRTKEQLSGCRASASSPSEFPSPRKKKKRKKEEDVHRCWKWSHFLKGWVGVRGRLWRARCIVGSTAGAIGGALRAQTRFCADAGGRRSPLLTPRRGAASSRNLPQTSASREAAPVISFSFAGNSGQYFFYALLILFIRAKERRRSYALCNPCCPQLWTKAHRWKFTRLRLGQPRRSSVQVGMLSRFFYFFFFIRLVCSCAA